MKNEIEAKFLSIDKSAIREKLMAAGFRLETAEYTMRRKTFDFSRVAPGRNMWGRVRQEANGITMSIKEVCGSGIDDTYEIELLVDSFDNATAFFQACNIHEKAFQENTREVWALDGVEVTIDTWPGLNPFIEIEGKDDGSIRKAAATLGFNFNEAVFGSIDQVYEMALQIPASTITSLPEITFSKPPTRLK